MGNLNQIIIFTGNTINLKKFLIILFIFGFSKVNVLNSQQLKSDSKLTEECFQKLYNFSFFDFDSCLNQQKNLPESYIEFLKLNKNWWLLITSDESKYITDGFVNIINGLELLEKSSLSADDKTFLKICFESFRLRLYLYNKQYWRAFSQTKILKELIEPTLGREEQYFPYYFTSGLFNYFAFAARKKYPLIFNDSTYKKASREKGLYFLEKCSISENCMLKTESNYFLLKIFLEVEENHDKAEKYAKCLIQLHKTNAIFEFYQVKILKQLKCDNDAIQLAKNNQDLINANSSLSKMQKEHLKAIINKVLSKSSD